MNIVLNVINHLLGFLEVITLLKLFVLCTDTILEISSKSYRECEVILAYSKLNFKIKRYADLFN